MAEDGKGAALAERDPTDVTSSAREAFQTEQRELIRTTIAPDLNGAQFDLFLELSARYGLNPLNGEIYASLMPTPGGGPKKFTPIVGRDGHLAIAQRHKSFQGIKADVVREFDQFELVQEVGGPDDTHDAAPRIKHSYNLAGADPVAAAKAAKQRQEASTEEGKEAAGQTVEGAEARARGRIVGAWALVYREDRAPSFFYAPWSEYSPRELRRAWKTHPSAMIRKCAVVNALREAFSLSGLYFEGEMDRVTERAGEVVAVAEPEWGEDPELATRLKALVRALNELKPGSYRDDKVLWLLSGKSDEERAAFADELERELTAAGGEVPEVPPEPTPGAEAPAPEGDVGVEEEVVDAQVVDDAAPEADPAESELADVEAALEEGVEDEAEKGQLEARRDELRGKLGLDES